MNYVIQRCQDMLRQLGIIDNRTSMANRKQRKRHSIRFEILEERELLSRNLEWIGGLGANWNSYRVWKEIDGGVVDYFMAGDNAVFDLTATNVNKTVKIPGNIQPSSIEFGADGYQLIPDPDLGGSISAYGSILTVTVEQMGSNPEFLATISAQITGSSTKLVVAGNTIPSPTTQELYPSGTLKITNINNDYGGGTEINNYSVSIPGGTSTSAGKLLVANPSALPDDGAGNYRSITVQAAGTLAVEVGSSGEWDEISIPTLFSRNGVNPDFEGADVTKSAPASNFGIWVDDGKTFDYSSNLIQGIDTSTYYSIPGLNVSSHYRENFVKMGIGTLTLGGINDQAGTSIQEGTLVASKPDALPHYDAANKIFVKEAHVVGTKYDFNMGYGYIKDSEDVSDTTHHYNSTEDPHSTLIVSANSDGSTTGWDKENIRKLLHGSYWDDTEIAHFENNTNFGIEVDSGSYFNISTVTAFQLGSSTKVGFVKLGTGTLEFGSHTAPSFSGPASIYGGRKWGRVSLVSRILKPQKGGCPKKTEKLVLGI